MNVMLPDSLGEQIKKVAKERKLDLNAVFRKMMKVGMVVVSLPADEALVIRKADGTETVIDVWGEG